MKSMILFLIGIFISLDVYGQILPTFGDERIGISLGSALKIGAGARAAGWGRVLFQ